jgi:TRAP-type C4-dicarboxylate transport system permease large subunit
MLILTVPLVYPMMMALGFDPIWYGVIMVKVAEIGCITPPFGINLFGLSAAVNAPMETMYRSIYPFFIMQVINVLILIAFPSICTFLPELM